MGPNLIWLVFLFFFKKRKFGHKKRYNGCAHTEERACEDMARQPSASQEEMPQEKPTLTTPWSWLPGFGTMINKCLQCSIRATTANKVECCLYKRRIQIAMPKPPPILSPLNSETQISSLVVFPESALDSKKIKPVSLKGNEPWVLIGRIAAEAEAPIFWSPDAKSQLTGKVPMLGKTEGREKRVSEDEMAGWHHWCNGHELGQTSGDGEGQGGLVCCSPWGHKE